MQPHDLFIQALQQRFGTRPGGVNMQARTNRVPQAIQQAANPDYTISQNFAGQQGLSGSQANMLMRNPSREQNFLPIRTFTNPDQVPGNMGGAPLMHFLTQQGAGKQNPFVLNQPSQQNLPGVTNPMQGQDVTKNSINTQANIPNQNQIRSDNAVIPVEQMNLGNG